MYSIIIMIIQYNFLSRFSNKPEMMLSYFSNDIFCTDCIYNKAKTFCLHYDIKLSKKSGCYDIIY